jgi:hypothetical protein
MGRTSAKFDPEMEDKDGQNPIQTAEIFAAAGVRDCAETSAITARGLETEILFRGVHGRIELDLSRRDKAQAGKVTPSFYTFSGKLLTIPEKFTAVIRAATHGTNCIGCAHSHYLRKSSAHQSTQVSSARPGAAIEGQSA